MKAAYGEKQMSTTSTAICYYYATVIVRGDYAFVLLHARWENPPRVARSVSRVKHARMYDEYAPVSLAKAVQRRTRYTL